MPAYEVAHREYHKTDNPKTSHFTDHESTIEADDERDACVKYRELHGCLPEHVDGETVESCEWCDAPILIDNDEYGYHEDSGYFCEKCMEGGS